MTGSFFGRPDHAGEAAIARPARGWRVGETVPWSVSWTSEQSYDLQISKDFPGLVDLVQTESPGIGAPRFAALHITRHRRGMVNNLCHVCGRPAPRGDRYIFPIESGGFATMPDESLRYAGNVPPVHLNCARRARRLCPHLSKTFAEPMPVPSEEARLVQRTDVPPGMEALAKTLPRHLKIVFSCYRLYGPRFSRQVAQLRAARGVGTALL